MNLDKENISNIPVSTIPKKSVKFANWPQKDIKEPHDNDVLYGRGGGTNHHPGNKRYRKLVESRKSDYINSKRLDKPLVALEIIREWRGQDPPGRFLKLDDEAGYWHDVGDKKAREKTSQALREKTPQIKKQHDEERTETFTNFPLESRPNDQSEGLLKSTRFQIPDKTKSSRNVARPSLARDHSLGRDYIQDERSLSVKGFSWDTDVLKTANSASQQSQNDCNTIPEDCVDNWVRSSPRSKNTPVAMTAFAIRGSGSSRGSTTGQRSPSRDYESARPVHPDLPIRDSRIDGNALDYPCTPDRHSLNWPQTQYDPHAPRPNYDNEHLQSTGMARNEESQHNYTFDPRKVTPEDGMHRKNNHPESNDYSKLADIVSNDTPSIYDQSSPQLSNDYIGDSEHDWPLGGGIYPNYVTPNRSTNWDHTSNSQVVESSSSAWSHNIHISSDNTFQTGKGSKGRTSRKVDRYSRKIQSNYSPNHRSPKDSNQDIPRPQPVKRETSHQNENIETKPQIKRLNRQRSVEFVSEGDMNILGSSLKESSLDTPTRKFTGEIPKPPTLSDGERTSTIDVILSDMENKSSSTFDVLETFAESLTSSDFPSGPLVHFADNNKNREKSDFVEL